MSAKTGQEGLGGMEREMMAIERPLEWYVPEGLDVVWANNVVIQHHEEEFVMTFFQVMPPMLLGASKEEVEAIKTVRATAVARITMSPTQIERLIGVLQDNFAKWKRKQEK